MALAPITVASVMAAKNEFQILLQRMVTNDPLTATLNRRAFAVRCRNLLASWENQGSVAVLVFDIDRMREINASSGHAAGDSALKSFARTARSLLPEAEDLGRIGSDEFAVLIPARHAAEAIAYAERIRNAFVEKQQAWGRPLTVRPTVSVGVTLTDLVPETIEILLTEASEAVQQAKASGGNRVVMASNQKLAWSPQLNLGAPTSKKFG